MFVTFQELCQTGVIPLHELCKPVCTQTRCMRRCVLQTYLTGSDTKDGVTGDFQCAQCGLPATDTDLLSVVGWAQMP